MAKFYTNPSCWDDDWFLDLPPAYKALKFLIETTCEGVGFFTVGFRRLSRDIGAEITREEFSDHFKRHMVWIGETEIWWHGKIELQYKELSRANKAHVSMARQLEEKVVGHPLTQEAQKVLDAALKILLPPPSTESQSTLEGESVDDQERVGRPLNNNHKHNQKEFCIQEGGVGETNAPPADDETEPFHAPPSPSAAQPPFELEPELRGEYSEAALKRMHTVTPGAQKAWLLLYPDAQWIREEATRASGHLDSSPGSRGHYKPWGAWFGAWLHRGWQTRGRAPPGFGGQAVGVPDYSKLK